MRFKQRETRSTGDEGAGAGSLWLTPTPANWMVVAPEGGFQLEASDWYVTVDERVGDIVGLVACPWPRSDGRGLPVFNDTMTTAWVDASELQRQVDELRDPAGAESRAIRIGDTFAVRASELETLEAWQSVRDVTREARAATKAAVAMVTVGEVSDPGRYLVVDDLDVAVESEEVPPSSAAGPTVASPAV